MRYALGYQLEGWEKALLIIIALLIVTIGLIIYLISTPFYMDIDAELLNQLCHGSQD